MTGLDDLVTNIDEVIKETVKYRYETMLKTTGVIPNDKTLSVREVKALADEMDLKVNNTEKATFLINEDDESTNSVIQNISQLIQSDIDNTRIVNKSITSKNIERIEINQSHNKTYILSIFKKKNEKDQEIIELSSRHIFSSNDLYEFLRKHNDYDIQIILVDKRIRLQIKFAKNKEIKKGMI